MLFQPQSAAAPEDKPPIAAATPAIGWPCPAPSLSSSSATYAANASAYTPADCRAESDNVCRLHLHQSSTSPFSSLGYLPIIHPCHSFGPYILIGSDGIKYFFNALSCVLESMLAGRDEHFRCRRYKALSSEGRGRGLRRYMKSFRD